MTIIEELERLCKQCTLIDEIVVARTIEAINAAKDALESCHEYEDNIVDAPFYPQTRQQYNRESVKLALKLLNE
jgi:hypothetical protein